MRNLLENKQTIHQDLTISQKTIYHSKKEAI
jgi:hypothetical protein